MIYVCLSNSLFFGFDKSLLRDEDTVEELTLILVSNFDGLVNTGAAEREGSVVNSIENECILLGA